MSLERERERGGSKANERPIVVVVVVVVVEGGGKEGREGRDSRQEVERERESRLGGGPWLKRNEKGKGPSQPQKGERRIHTHRVSIGDVERGR